MEENNISVSYSRYAEGELPAEDRALVEAAREAAADSFAPHSGLNVGAAALLDDGEVVTGANQESGVYPAGLCAERVLLFNIMSNRRGRTIKALAIAAKTAGKTVGKEIFPCGICAQTLSDAEARQGRPIRIIMSGGTESIVVDSAARLLPFRFKL